VNGCVGTYSYTGPYFGIHHDNTNTIDKRRIERENNKDSIFMINIISTFITISRVLDHEDINKGHRVPHNRNVGVRARIKSY
jgi:hypothetical protein